MIMHFDFQTYFRMLRLAWNEENPASRRRLLFRLLVKVPFVACFHAICFFLDGLLFPGLWRLKVRTPVFIIGHARSGTTLMHRLMSKDAERFSSFMLYELWFPSLLQKKVIRFLARCDRRFLGARVEKRVRVWEERKYGQTNKMHPMGLTMPEEDDFVLTSSCASGWWNVMLPYMEELDFHYVDDWPIKRRRRLMKFYKQCVTRQLYLNGADKIHLSKNPTFCGRVESLIDTFPDARIVVPMRNPYETIPSLLKLMQRAWQLRRWDEAKINGSLRVLLQTSFHSYTYPDQVLARHPEVPHAVVDYRDLVAQPKRTVEQVYAQLGFSVSPEFSKALVIEEERAKAHESTHRYSLEEFGLTSDVIHGALAQFFARYEWREELETRH
jgi:hypothetical protein